MTMACLLAMSKTFFSVLEELNNNSYTIWGGPEQIKLKFNRGHALARITNLYCRLSTPPTVSTLIPRCLLRQQHHFLTALKTEYNIPKA